MFGRNALTSSYRFLREFRRLMSTTATKPSQQQQQQQTVQKLLSTHHNKYHIEYNTYFSNHLPHGIIALYHLNAPSERIEAFAAKYARDLNPPKHEEISPAHMYSMNEKVASKGDEEKKITDDNFRFHLGKRQFFLQYFNYFQEKFGEDKSEKHRDEIVRQFFPLLSHGALHSALHPLIHLGWSLSLPAELSVNTTIEGLAYCAFAHFAYDEQVSVDDAKELFPDTKQLTPIQMLLHSKSYLNRYVGAMENGILKVPYHEMNIGEFQRCLVYISQHHKHFIKDCCKQLAVPSKREEMLAMLNDLLDAALLAYAASDDDFFILHICTGLMGVIHIAPRLEDAHVADTIRLMSYGWIAVWMAQKYDGADHAFMQRLGNCQNAQEERQEIMRINDELKAETEGLEWSALMKQAIPMDDEHTLKLVHVCHYRDQHQGELKALYKHVAKKRLAHTKQGKY